MREGERESEREGEREENRSHQFHLSDSHTIGYYYCYYLGGLFSLFPSSYIFSLISDHKFPEGVNLFFFFFYLLASTPLILILVLHSLHGTTDMSISFDF